MAAVGLELQFESLSTARRLLPPIELPAGRSDASDGCSQDDFDENMVVSHLFKCKIYGDAQECASSTEANLFLGPEGWGAQTQKKRRSHRVGGPKGGEARNFALFCSLWRLLVELCSLLKAVDLSKCAFGPLWGHFVCPGSPGGPLGFRNDDVQQHWRLSGPCGARDRLGEVRLRCG